MKKIVTILFMIVLYQSTSLAKEVLKYEVRTAPIALVAQWATLDFSFKLNGTWAAGPSVIVYASPKIGNMLAPSYNGTALGGHLYAYLNSFSQSSWYWGNHFYSENFESYPHAKTGHYELKGSKISTKFGYQLLLKSNFVFLTGAGVELRSYTQNDIIDLGAAAPTLKSQSGIFPFIEFKVGYKF